MTASRPISVIETTSVIPQSGHATATTTPGHYLLTVRHPSTRRTKRCSDAEVIAGDERPHVDGGLHSSYPSQL